MKKSRDNRKHIIVLFIFLLILVFIYTLGGKKQTDIAAPIVEPSQPSEPSPAPQPSPASQPADIELPTGSFVVFYTTTLGTEANNLSYGIYERYTLDSGANKINWDDTYYVVLGYVPSINRAYVVSRVKTDDITMHASTKRNKLFLVEADGSIKVIDPIKGDIIYTLSPKTNDFAIVESSIFYRDAAGDLLRLEFGSEPKKILEYNDSDNLGTLFGIGDKLVTIYYNPDNKEYVVREHSTATGKVIDTTNTFPGGNLKFFEGETAFYIAAQDETREKRYYIYRIELGDTAETLLGLDLDQDESAIISVDENNGKLFVTIAGTSPNIADSVVVHDLNTKESKEINFDPKINYTGSPPEYFVLN